MGCPRVPAIVPNDAVGRCRARQWRAHTSRGMEFPNVAPLADFTAIALGSLFALLLWTARRGNLAANRWLAACAAALALLSVGDLLEDTRWALVYPGLAHTTDWLIFAVGPCVWLVRAATHDERLAARVASGAQFPASGVVRAAALAVSSDRGGSAACAPHGGIVERLAQRGPGDWHRRRAHPCVLGCIRC